MLQWAVVPALVLLAILGHAPAAYAQTAAENYATRCSSGCHNLPSGSPSAQVLNAAGTTRNCILQANTNHNMGVGLVDGTVLDGIASYIAGFLPLSITAPSVGYRTQNNSITITPLYVDRRVNNNPVVTGLAAGTLSAGPSGSFTAGSVAGTAGAVTNPTIVYNHTGTDCSNNSFDVVGTGLVSTTNRRVVVPITVPTVTANDITIPAIAYSIAGTTITLTSPGTITVSGVGSPPTGTLALSGQVGAGSTNGTGPTTLTYTATGTTYSSPVTVMGKLEGVALFEPFGRQGKVGERDVEEIGRFHKALEHYRKQRWDDAEGLLKALAEASPKTKLYKLYLERIAYFRTTPPAADWDGVFVFTTK